MEIMKRLLKDIEKRYNVDLAYCEFGLFDFCYTLRLKFKLLDLHFARTVNEHEVKMVSTGDISYEAFRTHVFNSIDDRIQKYVHYTFYNIKEESENGN